MKNLVWRCLVGRMAWWQSEPTLSDLSLLISDLWHNEKNMILTRSAHHIYKYLYHRHHPTNQSLSLPLLNNSNWLKWNLKNCWSLLQLWFTSYNKIFIFLLLLVLYILRFGTYHRTTADNVNHSTLTAILTVTPTNYGF